MSPSIEVRFNRFDVPPMSQTLFSFAIRLSALVLSELNEADSAGKWLGIGSEYLRNAVTA